MRTEYSEILNFISQSVSLNSLEIEIVVSAFELINVPKNTRLEEEGKRTKYLYFVVEGYVRVFYVREGEERTTQINCPSRFITSFESYISNTMAYDNVEAVSDCKLLRIKKSILDELNVKIPKWAIFGEKIYRQALVYNEERTRDMILLNAEERYLKLIKNQPDIIKNVPLQYIASYIGIKPESLSRIRRQIT